MRDPNSRKENKSDQPSGAEARPKSEREVEVLYQRLGDRWYAFSLVDDEVFVGEIPLDMIHPDDIDLAA